MYRFFLFIFIIVISLRSEAQESYHELAHEINVAIPNEFYQTRDSLLKVGTDLLGYLPRRFSKKGDVDYTKELQRGLNKGGVLILPNHPLLINENGLQLKSNTKLVFRKNSKLIMKANSKTHYTILDITNVENVDVYFANIEGDRDTHHISKGEWGMGIRIQGGRNVNIYAPTIENCWGDGIYIRAFGEINSQDVSIYNFKINRARRNGISIISAQNLKLNKGLISNTHGTAPQSSIDIEPNRPSDILRNIEICDLTTHNSKGDGVMILLANLTLKSKKNEFGQRVNIKIENHIDIGSYSAVRVSGRAHDIGGKKYDNNIKIKGEVVFKNPTWLWDKKESPVRYSPKPDRKLEFGFNPTIKFENVTILSTMRETNDRQSYFIDLINKESKKL